MANPNFTPDFTTNQIYVGTNMTICLTDKLDGMETDIEGKAPTIHVHTDYAPVEHEHDVYAMASHTHSEYATTDHSHTGFASETHNHDSDYMSKDLQFTNDDGNILHSWVATDDVLEKLAALPCGVHTCYCPMASVNAPKQTEAWRFLVHKTSASGNYGWIMAFGSRGSVYSNYYDNLNWRGWKCIHDIEPEPLWTGAMYMTTGHTVEPTKTLSQCRNGWLLLWSDYNPGEGENNYDFSTTIIPKRAYTGQKWSGGQFLCMVPCHYAADGQNHITKCLHIHDTKIVGHENNTAVDRNDVVLRAIYEF